MIQLGHLTSYLTCPRLCYYRLHSGERTFTEYQAVREIYISLRRGFGLSWAEERARALNEEFNEDVFKRAAQNFVYDDVLKDFKPIDWDVQILAEKLGIAMIVDEIVEFNSEIYPLFVGLRAPKSGVWFKDAVKIAVASFAKGYGAGLVYYAYSGEIRRSEVTIATKRKVLKLTERVKMVAGGFLPERRRSEYCRFCSFAEECRQEPETFASKFL